MSSTPSPSGVTCSPACGAAVCARPSAEITPRRSVGGHDAGKAVAVPIAMSCASCRSAASWPVFTAGLIEDGKGRALDLTGLVAA
jgi:hypothetical protein